MKDPYASLGVGKDASQAEVKKAYRKLTQQFHPDKNPGDKAAEERFKDVSQAYEVLGDSDKRKLWDEFGEMSLTQGFDPERARAYQRARSGFGGGGRGGYGGGGGFDLGGFGNARETSFDDLLSSLFGGGSVNLGDFGRAQGPVRGRDISGEVQIDFEQALHGTTVPLRIDSGGEVRTLDVKIPMGFRDGGKLRLRGQGGAGQPRGDIILTIKVSPSRKWTRKGDDLEGVLPVPALAAYQGGPVDVDTPWGEVTMKIPAGTQGGRTLRLKGRGVRHSSDKKPDGNLIVRVQIVMPPPGDSELEQALQRLQGAAAEAPAAE